MILTTQTSVSEGLQSRVPSCNEAGEVRSPGLVLAFDRLLVELACSRTLKVPTSQFLPAFV